MTARPAALEAVRRVLDRGGDADDVLRGVLEALNAGGVAYAALRFVEGGRLVDGPRAGAPTADTITVPVVYRGDRVGELEAAVGDRALLEHVAALISAYVLVGWDTGGEGWAP